MKLILITFGLFFFLNTSAQFGAPHILEPNTGDAFCAIPADVDNDGDDDIIGSYVNRISWFENFQNDSLGNAQFISDWDPGSPKGLAVGDLDDDGDLDLVSAGLDMLGWHENNGDGTFAAKVNFSGINEWTYYEVAIDDLDNDGDQDIAAAATSSIFWVENTGGGNFIGHSQIGGVSGESTLAIGDMNNDGLKDIIIAGYTGTQLLQNQGNGVFATYNVNGGEGITAISIGDIDGDGLNDVATTSYALTELQWHKNIDGTNFEATQVIHYYGGVDFQEGVEIVDLNNDGYNDVLTGFAGVVEWFENTGNGNFSSAHHIGNASDCRYVSTSDLDHDGDLEVIVASHSNLHKLAWYENYRYHNNQVTGRVYADLNGNDLFDSGDFPLAHAMINATPQSDFSFTFANGEYFMNFSDTTGTYDLQVQSMPYWSVTTDSLFYHLAIDNQFVSRDSLDFGLQPTQLINNVPTELVGGFPRCNSTINYWVDLHNIGTTVPSGIIDLELDPQITFFSSTSTPDSVVGQHIYWHYDSLLYFEHEQLRIYVGTPDFQSIGDTLLSYVSVTANSVGADFAIFTDTLSQLLVCAYDPNDKTVTPRGTGLPGYIEASTEWLEYTVRFQNTGNDTSVHVVIKDQLDSDFNRNSFELLAFSHSPEVTSDQNGMLTIRFNNIMLPDSNVNELASHGFVRYRIRLRDNLPIGTEITNNAFIYFDQNPAVITNSTLNTIYICFPAVINPITEDPVCVQESSFQLPEAIPVGGVFSGNGVTGDQFNPSTAGIGEHTVFYTYSDVNCLNTDSVTITVQDCLSVDSFMESLFTVFPNPTSETLTINFFNEGTNSLVINDLTGAAVLSLSSLEGNVKVINIASLASGVYLLSVTNDKTGVLLKRRIVKN